MGGREDCFTTHPPWGVKGFITLPPNPLSSRRGGINITRGCRLASTKGRTLWTPHLSIVVRGVTPYVILSEAKNLIALRAGSGEDSHPLSLDGKGPG